MAIRKSPRPRVASRGLPERKRRSQTPKPVVKIRNQHVEVKRGPLATNVIRGARQRPTRPRSDKAIEVMGNRTGSMTILNDVPYAPVLILHDGSVPTDFIDELKDRAIHHLAIMTLGPDHIAGADLSIKSTAKTINAIHYALSCALQGFMFVIRPNKSIIEDGWDTIDSKPCASRSGIVFIKRQLLCDNIVEFARRIEGIDI